MTYFQNKYWLGFSLWIRKIIDYINVFALVKLVDWEIKEHELNVGYNPTIYPIFSILWLYCRIGKRLTIQIKNGKIIKVK